MKVLCSEEEMDFVLLSILLVLLIYFTLSTLHPSLSCSYTFESFFRYVLFGNNLNIKIKV